MNTPNDFIIKQLKTEPSVKLSWSKVDEATYYILSRKELNSDKDYETIAKTKKLFYYDRKLNYNVSYNYKLRAVFDEEILDFSFETEDEIKLVNTEINTNNFYNEGNKESSILETFPFSELKIVDKDLKPVKTINKDCYLRIPKFYLYIDEENNKINVSKIMINNEYDLHYSFIVDGELKDFIYIPCFANENLKDLNTIRNTLKENEVLLDFSILNLIQLLWLLYFQVSDPQVLTKNKTQKTDLNNLQIGTYDNEKYNSFLGLINLINSEPLFIDGIVLDNNKIKITSNPLENNNKGFKYITYDEFEIKKSSWIKKFEFDFFLFDELTDKENKHFIEIENENLLYLNLNPKSLFDYDFKTFKNTNKSKIRKCIYSSDLHDNKI